MKKIEKLDYNTSVYPPHIPRLQTVIEKVQELIDAHNELLETHTVKKPLCEGIVHTGKDCQYCRVTQPSNSEKEECCEMVKNGQGFHNLSCHKEEVREDDRFEKNGLARNPNPEGIYSPPKAPEKCYCGNSVEDHEAYLSTSSCHVKPTPEKKIHCFDCGAQTMKDCVHHKETDAPEKKCNCSVPDANDCGLRRATGKCPCRCHMYQWVKIPELALRKLATPSPYKNCCEKCLAFIANNERGERWCGDQTCDCHQVKLPTSSYEVTCGRCEKSIKHSC